MLNVDVSCIHTFWKSKKFKEVRQIERIIEKIGRAGIYWLLSHAASRENL